MIVGACGFGSTGSSAVTDYLSEFSEVRVLDRIEFTWVTDTDGLAWLAEHILRAKNRTDDSTISVLRYIEYLESRESYYRNNGIDYDRVRRSVYDFLDSVTRARWRKANLRRAFGNPFEKLLKRSVMLYGLIPAAEKCLKKQVGWWPLSPAYFAPPSDGFMPAARRHVRELLEAMGADPSSRIVALDQPFAGNNPAAAFPFFEDPYAVVVDRDPRDNYVFLRTMLRGRNHFAPLNDVKDFAAYYRGLRDGQPYKEPSERVLCLRFEDMVYDYDKTTERLRTFLGLEE
ncbi:MAG: sulfotransferase, partial [Abditibacteriota bacterium]|nr:sulfotransferase [Abditibacteriota bacterium]